MEIASDVWVRALIRRVELAGAFATVARRGDARAGAVLVRTFNPKRRRVHLYTQAIDAEGKAIWMQPLETPEPAAIESYVDRAARIDPDLWVVEIEDAEGARFLTEPVQS